MLFGIGISLGTALLQTKGAVWVANLVVAQFGLQDATALFILGVMTLFLIVIHLGFASATAMIPIIIAVLGNARHQHCRHGHDPAVRRELWLHSGRQCTAEHGGVRHGHIRSQRFRPHWSAAHRHAIALVMLLGATYCSWLGYA